MGGSRRPRSAGARAERETASAPRTVRTGAPGEPLASLVVDEANVLPPWQQIKEQIRVAYSAGRLRPGDVLPSIRALSRHLGVSPATVRHAYEDLASLGFLSSEPRKHVMVLEGLGRSPEAEELVRTCEEECSRMIDWAREQKVSAISLARLLLRQATEAETADASYVFVDANPDWAAHFASVVSLAWEVKVAGVTLDQVAAMTTEEIDRFTAILVNAYRVEKFRELVSRRQGVFPIRMPVHQKILRRMRRLPRHSTVLLVVADEDAPRISAALRQYFREEIPTDLDLDLSIAALSDLPDLATRMRRAALVVVSHNVWDRLPEKARRSARVVVSALEIDMESLERVRLLAGVLV